MSHIDFFIKALVDGWYGCRISRSEVRPTLEGEFYMKTDVVC